MVRQENVERILHLWQPWIESIKHSRIQIGRLGYNMDDWLVHTHKSLRELHLPGKLLLKIYYLCCIFSKYDENDISTFDKIQLPEFLYSLWHDDFYKAMEPVVRRHYHIAALVRIRGSRLTPDLDNFKDRPYPPAIWNKADIRFALEWEAGRLPYSHNSRTVYEALRKTYSPCYMLLSNQHPLLHIGRKVKRRRDEVLALTCAQLKDQGCTYREIGKKFGWKLQADSYDKMTRCSTARRYVIRGRQLRKSENLEQSQHQERGGL